MSFPDPSRNQEATPLRSAVQRFGYGLQDWISLLVALASACTVIWGLGPSEIFVDSTPTGGDMGAHVWGPAFLRDELLPSWQLRGWSPDWYAGFPAMHFYMVLPYLLIVVVDLLVPYGVAFKLVAVSGVVFMPIAAWLMGRLSRWKEPLPALLAVAALLFVFDHNFTIYGGNIASTLAGEFAFSIGLSLAIVYLGLVNRVIDADTHKVAATLVLGAVALCHPIPLLFAVAATVLQVVVRSAGRMRIQLGARNLTFFSLIGLLLVSVVWYATSNQWIRVLVCLLPLLIMIVSEFKVSIRLLGVGILGGALSAFWTVPFLIRRPFLNDMGWEKLDDVRNNLFFPERLSGDSAKMAIFWLLALAALGVVVGFLRWYQPAIFFLAVGVTAALAFTFWPQHRLWNARLLPFWYLAVYFSAAVGVYFLIELLRTKDFSDRRTHSHGNGNSKVVMVPVAVLLAAVTFILVYLGIAPGGAYNQNGDFRWGPVTVAPDDRNFVAGWAAWNFTGYEARAGYPVYRALIETMTDIGESYGCGRALWEYDRDELGSYGTPMAPMLLPYWTNGCIGSMEGLYFESSATVPFHFLMQSELSANPSRPMRGLPYRGLDLDSGIEHMQMSGVRYYLAFSEESIEQATEHTDRLELLAISGPWRIYRVGDSPLIEGLSYEPNVSSSGNAGGRAWTDPAVAWFNDPARRHVPIVEDGPQQWARVDVVEAPFTAGRTFTEPTERPLPSTAITEIHESREKISFSVDRLGVPVLIKTSYFPNWSAEGALGPYRATPNWMVVIPTDHHVELEFEATWAEYLGWAATLLGIVGVASMLRSQRREIIK